ncbi:uncharacterized protein LOC105663183 isoform X3 [Megachile rotundata]|uniref:uncharacterized protein LOC105663183 isoform X3 n=1 Tax=Megachile rotundata TaxID=143995 RepID=UPI003FD35E77
MKGFLCGNCWNFNPCCLRLANLVWTQFLKNDRSSDIGQLSGCQAYGDDVDQEYRKVREKQRSKGIDRNRLKGLKKRKLVGNVETRRTKNITVQLTRTQW